MPQALTLGGQVTLATPHCPLLPPKRRNGHVWQKHTHIATSLASFSVAIVHSWEVAMWGKNTSCLATSAAGYVTVAAPSWEEAMWGKNIPDLATSPSCAAAGEAGKGLPFLAVGKAGKGDQFLPCRLPWQWCKAEEASKGKLFPPAVGVLA